MPLVFTEQIPADVPTHLRLLNWILVVIFFSWKFV